MPWTRRDSRYVFFPAGDRRQRAIVPGIDVTRTCACCGQEIRDESSGTRRCFGLDKSLLQVLDAASGDAWQQGFPGIEVAHVVLRLIETAEAAGSLNRASRDEIADAAHAWLRRNTARQAQQPFALSADMETILARAGQRAAMEYRTEATTADIVTVIRFHANDLATASFLTEARFARSSAAMERVNVSRTVDSADDNSTRDLGLSLARPSLTIESSREEQDRVRLAAAARRDDSGGSRGREEFSKSREPAGDPDDRGGAARAIDASALRDIARRLAQHDRILSAIEAQLSRLAPTTTQSRAMSSRESAQNSNGDANAHASQAVRSQAQQRTSRRFLSSRRRRLRLRMRARWTGTGRGLWRTRFKRRTWASIRRKPRSTGERAAMSPRFTSLEIHRSSRDEQARPFAAVPSAASATAQPVSETLDDLPDTGSDDVEEIDADDETASAAGERVKRFYLSPDDEIIRAPSIGARTAAYLNAAGLYTVRDLLKCDAGAIARTTRARYITAERVSAWKDQARLVCTIPWLRGTHAQLLAGAGYGTLDEIVAAEAAAVSAAILNFATTREGQSVLRAGPPPDVERIMTWIGNASLAEPARAA